MSHEILYREYNPGEENHIVDFLKNNFKDWPSKDYKGSSIDYYKWKHLDSPYKKKNNHTGKKRRQNSRLSSQRFSETENP
jgi:hypothetical protein